MMRWFRSGYFWITQDNRYCCGEIRQFAVSSSRMRNQMSVAVIELMSGINATRVADHGEISASGLRLS